VLFVVWTEPLISIGKHTFLADALAHAGAVSIVDVNEGWPQISFEYALKVQPEYLVFAGALAESNAPPIGELSNMPGWRDLNAVRDGKVVDISAGLERPCPRLIDAIEELARLLHPEVFGAGATGNTSQISPARGWEVRAACDL